jgi:hypothetical protein
MPKKQTFKAVILDAGGGGAFVEVPFDVEAVFGSKRPKIRAMIEGVAYRGSLVRMGGERHMLLVLKGIRQQIGKSIGDEVQVTVAADEEPRVVQLPADLAKELKKDKSLQAVFSRLAYSHQREYVRWIESAKRSETRAGRVAKTLDQLRKKHKEQG